MTNPAKQKVMVSRHTERNVRVGISVMLLHRAPLSDGVAPLSDVFYSIGVQATPQCQVVMEAASIPVVT